ncbi:MAG TPA: SPOR domain-containing protein [Fibrobacteraceae bacterium]|nr:SPOR domain-containing protein [Fibrobacteraceae bacterium]
MNLYTLVPVLGAVALLSLSGCKKKEDKVAQVPPPPPVAQPELPVAATADPELQPIAPSSAPTPAPVAHIGSQQTSGSYVIQVDIKPSQRAANKVIAKLRESGIEAYAAEVENPGELEGTYYRVRIGYFPTIAEATDYAKNTLAPLGYAWWVDNKRNDSVGNPGGSEPAPESEETYSAPASSSDWNQAPAQQLPVTPQAEPQPAAAPAASQPEPEPAPAAPAASPESQPAAPAQPEVAPTVPSTPPPAPAEDAESSDDDEWQ